MLILATALGFRLLPSSHVLWLDCDQYVSI